MTRKFLQVSILSTLLIIVSLVLINVSLKNKTNISAPPIVTPSIIQEEETKDVPLLTTIAENLEVPWAIAFLPDKSILFTERPGRVRVIDTHGKLNPNPIAQINEVKPLGEGGLLGIAIHPDFNANHFVYLYYTYAGDTDQTLNRVARFTFDKNKLINPTTIVDAIPGAPFHNGGRIKFGPASQRGEPDKFLYITTGDAQNPSHAQDKNSLAGKILRVTDDGKAAPGNPFDNPIYSYGHRNSQGLAWDSNGTLWATEHGRSGILSGLDELNLIEIGKNYGWPTIQGDETRAGMETPKINSGPTTTWAPSGAAFLNGSVFFAGLKGQTLYQAVIQNNQVSKLKEHFKGEFGRIREVVVGPDNMLYITTSNRDGRGDAKASDDKIIRINPNKL